VAGYGGVILAVLYLWRRNLWANMLAHWISDGAGFLLFHQ
jgi:membrane protease YdiL (CAAX protease family)